MSLTSSRETSFLFIFRHIPFSENLNGDVRTTRSQNPPKFKGRTIGIVTLTGLQLLIGFMHVFFGFWLLSTNLTSSIGLESNIVYSVYTVAFGFAASILGLGIWLGKIWGTFGTIVLLLFVICVDLLAVLDLPTIPGVPKLAAGAEILYSAFISLYLLKLRIKPKRQITQ